MKHLIIPNKSSEGWGRFESCGKGAKKNENVFEDIQKASDDLSKYDAIVVTPKKAKNARSPWLNLSDQINKDWIVWVHFGGVAAKDLTRCDITEKWETAAGDFAVFSKANPQNILPYSKGKSGEDLWSPKILDLARELKKNQSINIRDWVEQLDELALTSKYYFDGLTKIRELLSEVLAAYLDLQSGSQNLKDSWPVAQKALKAQKGAFDELYLSNTPSLIDQRKLPEKDCKLDPAVKLIEGTVYSAIDEYNSADLIAAFKVIYSVLKAQTDKMS